MIGKLLAAALAALIATTVAAQTAPPIPPTKSIIDKNGVDLVTGRMTYNATELSIGSGSGALTLERVIGKAGWNTNLDLWMSRTEENGTIFFHVIHGAESTKFRDDGGVLHDTNLSGAKLEYISYDTLIYTAKDGTTVEFFGYVAYCTAGSICALPVKTKTRENLEIRYNYTAPSVCTGLIGICGAAGAYRLISVENNRGYQIRFNYEYNGDVTDLTTLRSWKRRTSATAINTAVEYCNFAAESCIVSNVWPTVYYDYSTSLNNEVYTVSSAAGNTIYSFVNAELESVRLPGSTANDLTVSYGSLGVASLSAFGRTTSYAMSISGNVRTTVATDALSQAWTYVADMTLQRLTSVTNPASQTTTYSHDASGRLEKVIYPEFNEQRVIYDGRGNVTETRLVAKPGSGVSDIVTTAGYPADCTNPATCNSPSWTRDALLNQTDYVYNPTHGQLEMVTLPAPHPGADRPTRQISYTQLFAGVKNANGGIEAVATGNWLPTWERSCPTANTCAGSPAETVTEYDYGPTGVGNNLSVRSVTTRSGDGLMASTATTSYDAVGNVVTVDGPLPGPGDTVTYSYDAARRLTGTVGPDPDGAGARKPVAERRSYDTAGRLTTVDVGNVDAAGAWGTFVVGQTQNILYDSVGRPRLTSLSLGSTNYAVAQMSYDAAGRVDCTVTRMNPQVFASLPASACTLGTTGAFGPDRIVQRSYDPVGRISKVTSGIGLPAAQMIDEIAYTYTTNGLVQTHKDGRGNVTTYAYDGFDRPAQLTHPTPGNGAVPSSTDYETYGYDANGNRTSWRRRGGVVFGFGYDALGRLTSKDVPGGSAGDVNYGYDLQGRLTSAIYAASGASVTFSYDALGRVLTQTQGGRTLSYEWDAGSRRTRMYWPDASFVVYDYDMTGALTAVRENGATSGAGVLAAYGYDGLGRRTSVTRGNGTVTNYGWDPASRLTSLADDLAGGASDLTSTFGYTPSGQLATRTRGNAAYTYRGDYNVNRNYAANGLNQYTTAGPTTFGYDANGNLTASGGLALAYDPENRLVSASGTKQATLGWDPLGRLETVASPTTGSTRFLYDGNDLVAEYDASGNMLRRYVHGGGTDEPLVWYEGATLANRRWLQTDRVGSVISVTDGTGNALSVNAYSAWGIPATNNAGRFQYTGQAYLAELGMYHYKARIYSPTMGRFLQTDPIAIEGGVNLYDYVSGDPVNATDPTGLCSNADGSEPGEAKNCGAEEIVVTATRIFKDASAILSSGISGIIDVGNNLENILRESLKKNHDYRTRNKVCSRKMTDNEMRDLLSRYGAPTATAGLVHRRSGENIVTAGRVIPGGVVRTTFSTDGLSVTNVTTPVHAFVGVIERSISRSGGETFISTHGYGDAGNGLFADLRDSTNALFGPGIFDMLDNDAADYAAANYSGC
jgi:RHS repeat-associated protein